MRSGSKPSPTSSTLRCLKVEVVSMWRKRFYEEGLSGLDERPRRGKPPTFPPGGTG